MMPQTRHFRSMLVVMLVIFKGLIHCDFFSTWDHFDVDFKSSAVAGTQLCCALDPPRQAEGLRMAYRVLYPNLRSLPYFLMISFPNILILPDNPPEWLPRSRHRART